MLIRQLSFQNPWDLQEAGGTESLTLKGTLFFHDLQKNRCARKLCFQALRPAQQEELRFPELAESLIWISRFPSESSSNPQETSLKPAGNWGGTQKLTAMKTFRTRINSSSVRFFGLSRELPWNITSNTNNNNANANSLDSWDRLRFIYYF